MKTRKLLILAKSRGLQSGRAAERAEQRLAIESEFLDFLIVQCKREAQKESTSHVEGRMTTELEQFII